MAALSLRHREFAALLFSCYFLNLPRCMYFLLIYGLAYMTNYSIFPQWSINVHLYGRLSHPATGTVFHCRGHKTRHTSSLKSWNFRIHFWHNILMTVSIPFRHKRLLWRSDKLQFGLQCITDYYKFLISTFVRNSYILLCTIFVPLNTRALHFLVQNGY